VGAEWDGLSFRRTIAGQLDLIDCFMILSHLMPQGALVASESDMLAWAILVGIYLTSMAVAMYPGREESSSADWDDFTALSDVQSRWD
jgi:hypothetical protein